jgi:hypothetical protein
VEENVDDHALKFIEMLSVDDLVKLWLIKVLGLHRDLILQPVNSILCCSGQYTKAESKYCARMMCSISTSAGSRVTCIVYVCVILNCWRNLEPDSIMVFFSISHDVRVTEKRGQCPRLLEPVSEHTWRIRKVK